MSMNELNDIFDKIATVKENYSSRNTTKESSHNQPSYENIYGQTENQLIKLLLPNIINQQNADGGGKLAVIAITPELAKTLSDNSETGINRRNRKPRYNDIDSYANDMKRGEFDGLRSDKLIIIGNDKDGPILFDGQHRLMAIAKSGQTLKMRVWYDAPETIRDQIDGNRARNVADNFNNDPNPDAGKDGNDIRRMARLEAYWRNPKNRNAKATDSISNSRLSRTQELDLMRANAHRYRPALKQGKELKKHFGITATTMAFCYLILSEIDLVAADEFFRLLIEPGTISRESPISILRDQLLISRPSKDARGHKKQPPACNIWCYVFQMWNAWRRGQDRKVVKLIDIIPEPI